MYVCVYVCTYIGRNKKDKVDANIAYKGHFRVEVSVKFYVMTTTEART